MAEYLGLTTMIVILIAPLSIAVCAVALPLAGVHLGASRAVAVALYTGGASGGQLLLGAIQGQGRFQRAATVDALGSVVALGAALWCALSAVTTPTSFVVAMTVGNGVQCVVAVWALGHLERLAITRDSLGRAFASGWRALGLTLGQSGAIRADRYVLGAMSGAREVGLYSVA